MRKRITVMVLCAVVVLCAGTSVAYYNTKTLGFDENAKVITKDDEKISIMDYNIYYKDIDKIIDKANNYIPRFINV